MPDARRLETLVLAWLLPRRGGAGARSELSRALAPLAATQDGAHDGERRLDEAIDALVRDALVTRPSPRSVALTERGRSSALAGLGVSELPARATWRSLQAAIVAQALDAPGAKQVATTDGLVAALLTRHYELELPPGGADFTRVRDAVGWQLLGAPSSEPFTAPAVLELLLRRELGGEPPRGLRHGMMQLASRAATGKRDADADALRTALLRRWLHEAAAGAPAAASGDDRDGRADSAATGNEAAVGGDAHPTGNASGDDLAVFAERVLEAARASATGRFGSKIFISHIWRGMAPPGAEGSAPPRDFKERLLDAHRAGLLDLSRADLVEAMDAADVRASEVSYFGATFHFVRVQGARPSLGPADSGSHR